MDKVDAALTQLANAFETKPKTTSSSKHSLMQEKINKYTAKDKDNEMANLSSSKDEFSFSTTARPWSYTDYKYRVMTFSKTANWFCKPNAISPLVCARFGWVNNNSVDVLYCHSCSRSIRHDGKVSLSIIITCIFNNLSLITYF